MTTTFGLAVFSAAPAGPGSGRVTATAAAREERRAFTGGLRNDPRRRRRAGGRGRCESVSAARTALSIPANAPAEWETTSYLCGQSPHVVFPCPAASREW